MEKKKTVKKAVTPAKKTAKPAVKTVKAAKPVKDDYSKLFDFQKTDVLLDLGCGDGAFLKANAKNVASAVGLDCDADALARAAESLAKTKNVTLLQGWLQDYNFNDATFDKVSLKNTLRSLNNHDTGYLLHKISKWIKPGGIIVVEDMITSFGLHRKDERAKLIEQEHAAFYGDKWESVRDSFYHDLWHAHASDYSLMMHHFLFTGFNVLKVIKHTSCLCTIVAQK